MSKTKATHGYLSIKPQGNRSIVEEVLLDRLTDAQLSAAAPELYKAVKQMVQWHEAHGNGTVNGARSMIEAYCVPVLKKARGQ